MQSGTALHLAILRKITQNATTLVSEQNQSGYKQKSFLKKLKKQAHTDQVKTNGIIPLAPLSELCSNRIRNKTVGSKEKSQRKGTLKLDNMTLSGWTTKSIQNTMQHKPPNRDKDSIQLWQKKKRGKRLQFVKKRQLSQANNFKIRAHVSPGNRQNFIPYYYFKKKENSCIAWKPTAYPLKHPNISLIAAAEQPYFFVQHEELTTQQLSTRKLSSYDAFIAQMKAKRRLNKHQNDQK